MHASRLFRTCLAATALVAAVSTAGGTAFAGDDTSKPATGKPPQVKLDPKQFAVPQVSVDADKFTSDTASGDKKGLAIPDTIDLGDSRLSLDAGGDKTGSGPRAGIDAADPAGLNPNLPQRKQSPIVPYVGFTLSKPTD
jgi:hypothetical protein